MTDLFFRYSVLKNISVTQAMQIFFALSNEKIASSKVPIIYVQLHNWCCGVNYGYYEIAEIKPRTLPQNQLHLMETNFTFLELPLY